VVCQVPFQIPPHRHPFPPDTSRQLSPHARPVQRRGELLVEALNHTTWFFFSVAGGLGKPWVRPKYVQRDLGDVFDALRLGCVLHVRELAIALLVEKLAGGVEACLNGRRIPAACAVDPVKDTEMLHLRCHGGREAISPAGGVPPLILSPAEVRRSNVVFDARRMEALASGRLWKGGRVHTILVRTLA
jgi:hypothetical protein